MQYAYIIIRETYLVKAFFSNIHIEHFFQVFFLFNTWYTIKIFSSMYSVYYIELKDLSSYKLGHWKCNSSTNKRMSFWLIYFANCIGISKRTFLDRELIKGWVLWTERTILHDAVLKAPHETIIFMEGWYEFSATNLSGKII